MLFISIIVSLISIIVNYVVIPLLTPEYLVHNVGLVLITGAR